MLLFVLVAGAMTLLSLALLLPALWRVNPQAAVDLQQSNIEIAQEQLQQLQQLQAAGELPQSEFDERKQELELALASSLGAASADSEQAQSRGYIISLLVAVALPAGAVFLYQTLGTPEALDPAYIASQQPAAMPGNEQVASIEELLPRLETHLSSNPDDLRGWRLLGVTYLRMQRFADAEKALGRALALAPSDPDLLLQLADAKAMLAGGQLKGGPVDLVRQALALRPDDVRGLWLLGMAHTQQNEHQAALDIWQRLATLLENEPEAAREIASLISESRAALGLSASPPPASTTAEPAAEDATASVQPASIVLEVSIDPSIGHKLDPAQTVFVYARAVEGPPMPLAAARHVVSDLPLQITLDDSMAMMAGMKLSNFSEVVVGARVSLSGNPVASSGDYFAEVQPVATRGQGAVSLTIFDTVP